MERQRTLDEYRGVDLTLFALILGVCEYTVTRAANSWFSGQLYTVSLTAAVCAIVLMRWGVWAAIHALLGGLVFWLASGGGKAQLVIYTVGNLGCLAVLPLLRGAGKEKIRSDKLFTALFALAVTLTMQLGRAAVALILGTEPAACVGFFTTDALSGLFALVVVSLARRLDGIFEDQKTYLRRLREREEKEKGGF